MDTNGFAYLEINWSLTVEFLLFYCYKHLFIAELRPIRKVLVESAELI